jgi:tetratricopeptide (TPR) repeat protein
LLLIPVSEDLLREETRRAGGPGRRRTTGPSSRRRSTILIAVGLVTAGASWAQGQVDPHGGHALGVVDFRVSCPGVQAEFNRAVALLHHMTYPQARSAFQRVAESDPRCAMAHWGIAMTLFQPLWPTRPSPEDLRHGWEEAGKARALEPPTERERLFVAAAEAFFQEPTSADYWARMGRWEDAMARVHTAFPEDPEATAFFALAHLATAPQAGASTAHADRAAALLLGIYEKNPEHPGAMHYLVHANDVPGRERESLEITRKYERVAPRNPHALHMPTHIYTRLGDWEGVIRGNLRAAEAALEHPAGEHGELVWDEFPHAIEYLTYAYLQRGEDPEAAAQVKRLQGTARLEPTFKTAFHLASIPARYTLERRAWSEAASLVPREPATLDWDRFAWPEAVSWFARGFGAVRTGGVDEARRARTRLEALEAKADKAGEQLFARQIRILGLALGAWLAHARGDARSAVASAREAADLEASTPKHAVTPAPTLPAHELLGDLLMEQKRFREAVSAYARSLELSPRRFNSLLGAARAARAAGDDASALAYYRELVAVAAPGSARTGLDEARRLVSEHAPR